MGKISLILQREYTTRVRKKSFIVMTLLGPVLFAAMFVLPIWFMNMEDTEVKTIAVVDSTGFLYKTIPDTKNLKFQYAGGDNLQTLKSSFDELGFYAILYIPSIVTYSPESVQMYSNKQPSMSVVMHISNSLEKFLRDEKLKTYNIDNIDQILKSVETRIPVQTFKITKEGEVKTAGTGVAMGVSYAGGFLIYLFIFMFGAQVMRGVIEEKTSRIVEVVISSVKPFELMAGKILGIALVGLTQFVLWVALTFAIVTGVQSALFPTVNDALATGQAAPVSLLDEGGATAMQPEVDENMPEIKEVMQNIRAINWVLVISTFIFYFLGGYLLYGSLFAAIGSAVDNETDTQQFMMPVTIPLIIALYVMFNTFQNPESSLTWWFSVIPFTSPVVMMARIPFGVDYWDLIISMVALVAAIVVCTWFAGKIYRVGILMYGKKPTYKELVRWIRLS